MTAIALVTLAGLAIGAPPRITLDAPVGGWSTSRIVTVNGRAQGAAEAVLVINGSERPLQLGGDGAFQAVFLSPPGRNQVSVIAWDAQRAKAERHIAFFSKAPKLDLVVMLFWDTGGTDIDLHVLEPSGEECFYGHRQTKAGALLDVDDTDGWGPEVYTLADAPHGEYKVRVKYYSDNGHPQTLATVDVVLYPGTDREQRQTLERMLTKTGDVSEVGGFTITQTGDLSVE